MTKKISDNIMKDYKNNKIFLIDGKGYWINGIEYDYSRRTLTVEFMQVMTSSVEKKESDSIWKKMNG